MVMIFTIRLFLITVIFSLLFSCSSYNYYEEEFNSTIIIDSTLINEFKPPTSYIKEDSNDIIILKTFIYDSVLISIERFIDFKHNVCFGESIYWDSEGNILLIENYNKKGKLDGKLMTYHSNGKIKREDFYENGKLKSGKCFDSSGNLVGYYPYEVQPAIDLKMLSDCIVYPEELRQYGLEESVEFRLLISEKGKIIKAKYNNKHYKGFLKEALRCLLTMDIKPAYSDGDAIKSWITIPITFRLR